MRNFLAICLIAVMSLSPVLVTAAAGPVSCGQDQEMATSMDQEDHCCCESGSCVDVGQSCQCDGSQLNPIRRTAIGPGLPNPEFEPLGSSLIKFPNNPFPDGLYRPPISL